MDNLRRGGASSSPLFSLVASPSGSSPTGISNVATRNGLMNLYAQFSAPGFLHGHSEWPAGMHALMGPSGSGKTTLLRSLAGLGSTLATIGLKDSIWQGPSHDFLPAYRRPLAYVPQRPSLIPFRTIGQQIRWIQPDSTVPLVTPPGLALSDFWDRLPHTLSGGQQQQIALVRALATTQPVLLLDESLSQVDHIQRQRIMHWLFETRPASWILFSTHQLSEALTFSDTVTIIYEGKVFPTRTPEDCLIHPDTPETARLLGYCGSFALDNCHHLLIHPDYLLIGAFPDKGEVLEADVTSIPGPSPLERTWRAVYHNQVVQWRAPHAARETTAQALTLLRAPIVSFTLNDH
ncbi:hypothetical protein CO251_16720 [Sulfobacillus sp. hq2]|nr:hypothetical protein CO251_16720 [Sulfobacillus sp. hq2]